MDRLNIVELLCYLIKDLPKTNIVLFRHALLYLDGLMDHSYELWNYYYYIVHVTSCSVNHLYIRSLINV